MKASVQLGEALDPISYLLYTCDIPFQEDVIIATFADDRGILEADDTIEETTVKLYKTRDNKVANNNQ